MKVNICQWFEDRSFAYSITYDEGFVDVLANALPIHREYNIPGHVDVVVGQIGKKRNAWLSTMNNFFHMDYDEIAALVGENWGVGNHSFSHFVYPYQAGLDLYREVVWSKYTLEDALGIPVRIFTIPNDSYNYEPIISLVKRFYIGCVYIDGGLNRDDVDIYKIGNNLIGAEPKMVYPDNYNKKEPYNWPRELNTSLLSLEYLKGSWLLDTTHAVGSHIGQWHKNITSIKLAKRFEKILSISNGDVWAVKPDEVIDYILMRRNTIIQVQTLEKGKITITFNHKPVVGVVDRKLTIKLCGLPKGTDTEVVIDEGVKKYPVETPKLRTKESGEMLLITLDVHDGLKINVLFSQKQ